jgi:PleD family two-component response regulator
MHALARGTAVRFMKPLALLYYSNLMPGSQLSNRLLDLGYRVHNITDMTRLSETCQQETPLLVVAEILPGSPTLAGIAKLRKDPATQHIPVLGYSPSQDPALQTQATDAGVSLLAGNAAITEHLPRLLDQVLQVD